MGGSVGDALCVGWVVLEAPAQWISPSSVKPNAPHLYPDVDFSEDDPLEAVVQWSPPTWPPHKVLVCRFYYRRCRMPWVMVSIRELIPEVSEFVSGL